MIDKVILNGSAEVVDITGSKKNYREGGCLRSTDAGIGNFRIYPNPFPINQTYYTIGVYNMTQDRYECSHFYVTSWGIGIQAAGTVLPLQSKSGIDRILYGDLVTTGSEDQLDRCVEIKKRSNSNYSGFTMTSSDWMALPNATDITFESLERTTTVKASEAIAADELDMYINTSAQQVTDSQGYEDYYKVNRTHAIVVDKGTTGTQTTKTDELFRFDAKDFQYNSDKGLQAKDKSYTSGYMVEEQATKRFTLTPSQTGWEGETIVNVTPESGSFVIDGFVMEMGKPTESWANGRIQFYNNAEASGEYMLELHIMYQNMGDETRYSVNTYYAGTPYDYSVLPGEHAYIPLPTTFTVSQESPLYLKISSDNNSWLSAGGYSGSKGISMTTSTWQTSVDMTLRGFDDQEDVTASAFNDLNGRVSTLEQGSGGSGITGITMNGSAVTVTSGVADLGTVITDKSDKQDIIDSSHKLSADLVDDTSTTNKFVTASDKSTWSGKQDALVSGTNIKTVNGNSLLGSGDIVISGGGGTVDEQLSPTSTNAVQNKAIYNATYVVTEYQLVNENKTAPYGTFVEGDRFRIEIDEVPNNTYLYLFMPLCGNRSPFLYHRFDLTDLTNYYTVGNDLSTISDIDDDTKFVYCTKLVDCSFDTTTRKFTADFIWRENQNQWYLSTESSTMNVGFDDTAYIFDGHALIEDEVSYDYAAPFKLYKKLATPVSTTVKSLVEGLGNNEIYIPRYWNVNSYNDGNLLINVNKYNILTGEFDNNSTSQLLMSYDTNAFGYDSDKGLVFNYKFTSPSGTPQTITDIEDLQSPVSLTNPLDFESSIIRFNFNGNATGVSNTRISCQSTGCELLFTVEYVQGNSYRTVTVWNSCGNIVTKHVPVTDTSFDFYLGEVGSDNYDSSEFSNDTTDSGFLQSIQIYTQVNKMTIDEWKKSTDNTIADLSSRVTALETALAAMDRTVSDLRSTVSAINGRTQNVITTAEGQSFGEAVINAGGFANIDATDSATVLAELGYQPSE